VIDGVRLTDVAAKSIALPFPGGGGVDHTRFYVQNMVQTVQDFVGRDIGGLSGTDCGLQQTVYMKACSSAFNYPTVVALSSTSRLVTTDVVVHGMKDLSADYWALKLRDNSTRTNAVDGNYLKCLDTSNGLVLDFKNGAGLETLYLKGVVTPPNSAGAYTTTIKIPYQMSIKRAVLQNTVAFGTSGGLTGYTIGFSGVPAALATMGTAAAPSNPSAPTRMEVPLAYSASDRFVTLTPSAGQFNGTGTVHIALELEYNCFNG
jgi:hypothetical protein